MTDQWRIIQGDARGVLAGMDDQSVHCVVCSPPYWGLRSYPGPSLLWGGRDECEHKWGEQHHIKRDRQHLKELGERLGCGGGNKHSQSDEKYNATQGQFCRLCGCWKGSLGLEPTPELYIEHLVGIFRQVRRVLRDDGTVWCNIAGCYAGSMKGIGADGRAYGGPKQQTNVGSIGISQSLPDWSNVPFKPKDWVPIPWMLGMALQADGWWLRSPIIWAKGLSFCEEYSGSVMPESVRDRPTTSYEYLLLLTKKARYYYDQDAIREKHRTWDGSVRADYAAGLGDERIGIMLPKSGGILPSGIKESHPSGTRTGANLARAYTGGAPGNPAGRNLRSVWAINPHAFKEAHFATFPPALVRPAILAGTSEKGCCSAPKTKLRLRQDLTLEEREKIVEWLAQRGLLDVR